ncbi:MAG: hypothetical protein FJ100_01675 [Deltaproteobacteria bacterium]|nr:hypothetical protein [Deltaproteobacteria bacterium]
MTRRTPWTQGIGAAVVACAAAVWSTAAWAVPVVAIQSIETASGSDWAPPSHFGVGASTPGQANDVHYINRADCKAIMAAANPVVKINWTWAPSFPGNYSGVVKVAPRGKACGETTLQKDDTNTSCIVHSEQTYKLGATYSVEVQLHQLLGKDTTCDENSEQDAFVYFLVNDQASTGVNQQVVAFKSKILVDLAGPPAPTLSSVAPGGGNLTATWKHGDSSKVAGSHVYWATLPIDPTGVAAGTIKPQKSALVTTKYYQIKDLTNGTPYYVVVTAVDDHGNESGYSELGKGTPIDVIDAWQHYQTSGGTEEGGFAPCSAGARPAAGGWWLAGLAALLAIGGWRWRRGLAVAALVLTAVGTGSATAYADSPLDNSAEFRATRYLPGIDAPFGGKAKPYADIFGNADWEIGGAADVRLWDRFGSLSVGLGYGWFTKEGKGLEKSTGKASTDATTLKIVPLSLDLTYRLDPLAHKAGIPFVPYAKIGAMYAFWWMLNGSGDYATYTTTAGTKLEALGGTGGWHAVAGLRFLMDVLEPSAARSFDIEMGVNHSYLYIEYDRRVLNDFGNAKSIDLSDGVFTFGLAFDL